MKDRLLLSVKRFLEARLVPGKPVLLAYSGGPDSKVLLHLLIALKQRMPLELHVAHVDHGWRSQSALQAAQLKAEVESAGLPFHLHTLGPSHSSEKNMEARGREARLIYFKQLTADIGSQALMFAHQADDYAETVLKRIFEGAHLRYVKGMTAESVFEGMLVWRPLLSHAKKELIRWLDERKLAAIDDETNRDARFLRGRMREQLLPMIASSFGKQIQDNLCHLGRTADELSAYFSRKLAPYFETLNKVPQWIEWDLSRVELERIEWEYLFKEWLEREKIVLSRQLFEQCVEGLTTKQNKGPFSLKQGLLYLNFGIISFKCR
jgi:tRNA(Ile)-lysidine synthase